MNVTYAGLQKARPELPILIISMKDLPTSKTRLPVTSTSYTNPLNPDDYEKGNASFKVGADAEKKRRSAQTNLASKSSVHRFSCFVYVNCVICSCYKFQR